TATIEPPDSCPDPSTCFTFPATVHVTSSTATLRLTVTDSGTCANHIRTDDVVLTVNPLPDCTASQVSPVACFGQANGSATVTPTGGNGGNTFAWDTTPVQTTATATGLSAGSHSVTVTDSKGCTTTCSVTITQPTVLACTASQ